MVGRERVRIRIWSAGRMPREPIRKQHVCNLLCNNWLHDLFEPYDTSERIDPPGLSDGPAFALYGFC